MPRVRFTLRWMMIAVAIVAVILGGEMMRRRRATYLERATEELVEERRYQEAAEDCEQAASEADSIADQRRHDAEVYRQRAVSKQGNTAHAESDRRLAERQAINNQESAEDARAIGKIFRARADYHRNLRRKYANAGRRPWLGVSPDPPEPDWDAMLPEFMKGPLPRLPEDRPDPH